MVLMYESPTNITSCNQLLKQKEEFYKIIDNTSESLGHTNFISTERFKNIFKVCKARKDGCVGKDFKNLRDMHSQAFKWVKDYEVIELGNSQVLVYSQLPQEDGNYPALDTYKQVSYYDNLFDDIRNEHIAGNDHCKGRTLENRIKEKYGKSIVRWILKAFTDTCPLCIKKVIRTKTTVGHQPIITKGFGSRGQVDLLDFQSMPDGDFKFLMNYQDHGIKLLYSVPIVNKRARSVAWCLVEIFCLIGPPTILQADNGREFNNAASLGTSVKVTDEVSCYFL